MSALLLLSDLVEGDELTIFKSSNHSTRGRMLSSLLNVLTPGDAPWVELVSIDGLPVIGPAERLLGSSPTSFSADLEVGVLRSGERPVISGRGSTTVFLSADPKAEIISFKVQRRSRRH